MNRITYTGILVGVVLMVSMLTTTLQLPVTYGQEAIVVDEDGAGEPNDCEASTPAFTTIQTAIDDLGTGAGDVIVVCPGTYNEHVDANKAGIKLLGWGCGRTIIDPPAGNVISVLADSITIDGFEITGGVNGIETSSGVPISFTVISHNCIHDNTPEDGINIDKGSNNIIRSNDIFNNADEGIFLGDSTNVSGLNWIGNNEVHNNGSNGITMQVTSSTGNEIDGNEVRDHGASFWGIDVDSDILVEHNKVISNDGGGILVRGDRNTITYNISNENGKEGFRTLDIGSSLNIFDKNTARGNGEEGFSDKGSMNTFSRNTAKSNGLEGFGFDGTDGVFTDNASKMNTIQGFLVTGDDGDFTGNRARNNGGDGFDAGAATSGNTFDSNKSNKNGDAAGEFGFDDDSVGGGTLGTANTYIDNKCNNNFAGGSDPSGLCTPQV